MIVDRFLGFIKSEKMIIAVSLVFVLIIAGYNVHSLSVDKNEHYAYSSAEVENISVELVDINKADVKTLCTLPGIGENTANEIIRYRNENGHFESIEQIKEIKGIGFQDYIRIAPMITV